MKETNAAPRPSLQTHFVWSTTIACEGDPKSSGAGHPRVYLNLSNKGEIDCPYCGRHYVLSTESQAKLSLQGHQS
ncbi:MAG: zinc-finger domain-containing protein [Alphaproteobacteria bacterium]|nr:MAG: zinc-finger domain-containing protein [Alphaproteobacteria bacterium]